MITRSNVLTIVFWGLLNGIVVAKVSDAQAPQLLPHAVMSMLSPSISEHHRVQRGVKHDDVETSPAEDLSPRPVPVKAHEETKESEETSLKQTAATSPKETEQTVVHEAAKAGQEETNQIPINETTKSGPRWDDELPMPSFALDPPALRGSAHADGVPPALDFIHPNFVLNASSCLEVRQSTLNGAGNGCFAVCDIPNGTLLGEYKGKTFMTSGKVPNDGAYTWKVPACDDASTVLTREDVSAWATCGNRNGFVYVDAADLSDHKFNPLRYVNGAWSKEQRMGVNVDAVINDRRVYYFSSRSVRRGDEMVIDYGPQYWAKGSSPPPPSPSPPAPSTGSADSFAAASKFEKQADEEAHSILEDADKLGARLRAAREKAKEDTAAARSDDIWADEREADQANQVPKNAAM